MRYGNEFYRLRRITRLRWITVNSLIALVLKRKLLDLPRSLHVAKMSKAKGIKALKEIKFFRVGLVSFSG
jgi:hypothetical protein